RRKIMISKKAKNKARDLIDIIMVKLDVKIVKTVHIMANIVIISVIGPMYFLKLELSFVFLLFSISDSSFRSRFSLSFPLSFFNYYSPLLFYFNFQTSSVCYLPKFRFSLFV